MENYIKRIYYKGNHFLGYKYILKYKKKEFLIIQDKCKIYFTNL